MDKIDQFLQSLNGGMLMLSAEHARVEAYTVRIQAERALDDAESDFAILTPTRCYKCAYCEPELKAIDRRADMPHNPIPDHPDFLRAFGTASDWPVRDVKNITGLTIHHTLSDNPLGTFQWITRPRANGGKGYPRGQYHYWISRGEGAPISHLLDDTVQCWHDHTGTYQKTLSIGMAGRHDYTLPPEEQLWNTARLCWYLIRKLGLTVDDVEGHTDRSNGITACPGWYARPGGEGHTWRRDFDIALQCAADGKEWAGYHA